MLANQLIAEIKAASGNDKVEFLPLDLESLASARRCAELFLARGLPLHLLINNAGLAITGLTADGFERQFQVNFLGHFVLTTLLLDAIKSAGAARIVMVGSRVYESVGDVEVASVRQACGYGRAIFGYGRSKLAMVWGMNVLKEKLAGTQVVVHTVHPGGVWTDIYAPQNWLLQALVRLVSVTPEAAVNTILNPALLPEYGSTSGLYFNELQPKELTAAGKDMAKARALWQQCEAWAAESAAAAAAASAPKN